MSKPQPQKQKLVITDGMMKAAMSEMIKKIDNLGLKSSETAIIAIGRGGFVPAQYAAYALDNINLFSIQSSLYNNTDTQKQIHNISGVYNIPYEEFKTILVIDDIYDSGVSMDNVIVTLEETARAMINDTFDSKAPRFIPCVVYTQKKKKTMKTGGIIWGRKIKKVDGVHPWLVFPWDQLTPIEDWNEAGG